MKKICMIYAYYMNPGMLEFQYDTWSSYSDDTKDKIEIILFDDCSPIMMAFGVPRPDNLPNFSLYRMIENVAWGSDACRNRAASITDAEFLFLCDIDHVLPEETLRMLLDECDTFKKNDIITFPRLFVKNMEVIHPGANIFLMRKDTFWAVGGYDEYLLGFYGTDIPFRKRLYENNTKILYRGKVVVYCKDIMPNCDTTTFSRSKDGINKINEKIKEKELLGINDIVTLSKPFEKLI
jgi:hypothetical protein